MKLFISHISEEASLALVLKDWIESSFAGQCQVFVSSDKDDIPAGSRWLDEIDKALVGAGENPLKVKVGYRESLLKRILGRRKRMPLLGGKGYRCQRGHEMIAVVMWRT
jgi:hypothetical protein